jgi:hypothetical protein
MLGTYLLVAIGLIIFRAPSVGEAWGYVVDIFGAESLVNLPGSKIEIAIGCLYAAAIMLLEWRAFIKGKIEYAIQSKSYGWRTYVVDFVIFLILFVFAVVSDNAEYIYMRF